MEQLKVHLNHYRYDFTTINEKLANMPTIAEKLAYLLDFKTRTEQHLIDNLEVEREKRLAEKYEEQFKKYIEKPYYVPDEKDRYNSFSAYLELKNKRRRSQDIVQMLNAEINKIENWMRIQSYTNVPHHSVKENINLKDIFHNVKDKIEVLAKLENSLYKGSPIITKSQIGYTVNIGKGKIKFLAALKEILKEKGLLNTTEPKKLRDAFLNEFNIPYNKDTDPKQFQDSYSKDEDLTKYLKILNCIK